MKNFINSEQIKKAKEILLYVWNFIKELFKNKKSSIGIVFYTVVCYIGSVQYTIRRQMMNTQFKKGIVEMCVLSLMEKKDLYGFEVIEALAKAIDVNENTVYPILRRLTSQQLFTTYVEQTSLGAPRKYYHLTDLGKKRLDAYKKEWQSFLRGVHRILGGSEVWNKIILNN